MQESEQLSQVIAEIYDTVLDRSLWPAALKKISTAFGQRQVSAIYWSDAANNSGYVIFDDGGIAPGHRQLYFEKYVSLNPTLTLRCFFTAIAPRCDGRSRSLRRISQNPFLSGMGKAAGAGRFRQYLSGEGGGEVRDVRGVPARAERHCR